MQGQIDRTAPDSWPFVLRVDHLMAITGMGKNKVLDLLQSAEIPGKRVGKNWLVNKADFIQWLRVAN